MNIIQIVHIPLTGNKSGNRATECLVDMLKALHNHEPGIAEFPVRFQQIGVRAIRSKKDKRGWSVPGDKGPFS